MVKCNVKCNGLGVWVWQAWILSLSCSNNHHWREGLLENNLMLINRNRKLYFTDQLMKVCKTIYNTITLVIHTFTFTNQYYTKQNLLKIKLCKPMF